MPRRASASAVPGPIAATRTGAERAGVETGRREPAIEERVDAVRRREHEPRVARRGRAARSRPARARSTAARSPRRRAASSRARSSLACSRARVTTTRAAEQRALLEPREVERGDVADDDRARRLDAERRRSSRASPRTVRCSGRVPQRTAATGVSGARPPAISASAMSATRPAPMRMTSVPPRARERVPVGVGACPWSDPRGRSRS